MSAPTTLEVVNPRAESNSPTPLVVAASIAAVEGALLLVYAVLELVSVSSQRVTMGLTTSAFFAVYGAALVLGAWSIAHGRAWARGLILLAQLIQLGVAWNLRGGDTTVVAVGLAVTAVIVIAGVVHPASIDHLADEP